MGCNCRTSSTLAPRQRFGVDLCLHVTLAGFICAWLLMIPLLFVRLPWAATLALSVPALFFTPWLGLHLAGRRRLRAGR